jgi:hypothetical protein
MSASLQYYEPGLRSGAWRKMRVNRTQDFVIGGYAQINVLACPGTCLYYRETVFLNAINSIFYANKLRSKPLDRRNSSGLPNRTLLD